MARWSDDWTAPAERRSRCVSLEAQIKREIDAPKRELSRLNLPFTLPKPKPPGAMLRDLLKDSAAEIAVALQKERLEGQLRAKERELAAAERRLSLLPVDNNNQEGVLQQAEERHRLLGCLNQ